MSNLLFRIKLPRNPLEMENEPLVSVLIPARNEENNLPILVNDILSQNYPNLEIIIYNDASNDDTGIIAGNFSKKYSFIKVINGISLPEGWYGKPYACWNLGKHAKGDYLLFLDADVRISGNILLRSISYMQSKKLGLISIFPKQVMVSFGEKLVVPLMNIILLSLLPLVTVRSRFFPSLSAANGQFMLYNRDTYNKFNPYEQFKSNRVEDIAIAYFLKKNRVPVACFLGDDEITCRMYSSFSEAIKGFAKNVISFFRNSTLFALFYVFVNTFSLPFTLYFAGFQFFIAVFTIQLITLFIIFILSNQSVIFNILTQPIRQIVLIFLIFKSLIERRKKGYLWKGRYVK
ncbi:MAG: glycosyltransferase [Ignavibacteria bacterium]|nr:glycosyltransferase [Ignavibacteria bacterium]